MPGLPNQDPTRIFYALLTYVVAITIHEFMHAWTAWRLGDDTAARMGRITLNPASHFDPFGFFGFVIIALGFPGFAWGKPVPVNPNRFRRSRLGQRGGMALVAFAGPLSNVVLAGVAAIPLRYSIETGADLGELGRFLFDFLWINAGLAAFNMIPIPPLDGSKILLAILPNFWYPILAPLQQYGFGILLVLIVIGRVGDNIITAMSGPVFSELLRLYFGSSFLNG